MQIFAEFQHRLCTHNGGGGSGKKTELCRDLSAIFYIKLNIISMLLQLSNIIILYEDNLSLYIYQN